MIGGDVKQPLENRCGLLEPIELPQQVAGSVEAFGKERPHRQRGVEIGERMVGPLERQPRASAAVIGVGPVGADRQCLVVARDRLGEPAKLHERGGAAEPRVAIAGIDRQRPLEASTAASNSLSACKARPRPAWLSALPGRSASALL